MCVSMYPNPPPPTPTNIHTDMSVYCNHFASSAVARPRKLKVVSLDREAEQSNQEKQWQREKGEDGGVQGTVVETKHKARDWRFIET